MKRNDEKRRYQRHPIWGEFIGYILPNHAEAERTVHGTVLDVSDGGLGVVTLEAVNASIPTRCELRLGGLPCSIPTLAQVRWVETGSAGKGARIGLQFLL